MSPNVPGGVASAIRAEAILGQDRLALLLSHEVEESLGEPTIAVPLDRGIDQRRGTFDQEGPGRDDRLEPCVSAAPGEAESQLILVGHGRVADPAFEGGEALAAGRVHVDDVRLDRRQEPPGRLDIGLLLLAVAEQSGAVDGVDVPPGAAGVAGSG